MTAGLCGLLSKALLTHAHGPPHSTLSLIPNTDVHMHTDSQRSTTQYSFINTEYRRSHAHGQSAFYHAALFH